MSDDERQQNSDPFRPPALSTLVGCLHCQEEYDSYRIEWRIETCHDGKKRGFWCCPIEGCDGRGFGFDIFPVDPDWRDEEGNLMWVGSDDDEDDEFDDEDFDEPEDESPNENDGTHRPNGTNGMNGKRPTGDEPLPW